MGENLVEQGGHTGAGGRWQSGPAGHEPLEQAQATWEVSVHHHAVKGPECAAAL